MQKLIQRIPLTGDARAIVETLKNMRGQNISIAWRRKMKTRANCPFVCEKQTEVAIRTGIDYSNLATVKQGIESGERGEVQSLPWGEWAVFPFIIKHTPKGQTEIVEYVRLYPNSNKETIPQVQFFLNGVECSKNDVSPYCLASEFRDNDETPLCFTIKRADLLYIGENELIS